MWSGSFPYLMIFDLYRRTNNRAGDELAPRFRRRFNLAHARIGTITATNWRWTMILERSHLVPMLEGETGVRWKRRSFWRSCCMTTVADLAGLRRIS